MTGWAFDRGAGDRGHLTGEAANDRLNHAQTANIFSINLFTGISPGSPWIWVSSEKNIANIITAVILFH